MRTSFCLAQFFPWLLYYLRGVQQPGFLFRCCKGSGLGVKSISESRILERPPDVRTGSATFPDSLPSTGLRKSGPDQNFSPAGTNLSSISSYPAKNMSDALRKRGQRRYATFRFGPASDWRWQAQWPGIPKLRTKRKIPVWPYILPSIYYRQQRYEKCAFSTLRRHSWRSHYPNCFQVPGSQPRFILFRFPIGCSDESAREL